ncbi:MAG: hypothetical protein GX855_08900, partial [Firmicutes bacterium]|nr:hypothetical protein [Bacillota bacterium]
GVTVVIVTHDRAMAYAVDRFVEIRDGKISVETVRRRPLTQGEEIEKHEESHDEYVMLDSAGRLQIPPDLREALGIGNRLQLEVEGDKLILKVPEGGSLEETPPEAHKEEQEQGFAG